MTLPHNAGVVTIVTTCYQRFAAPVCMPGAASCMMLYLYFRVAVGCTEAGHTRAGIVC